MKTLKQPLPGWSIDEFVSVANQTLNQTLSQNSASLEASLSEDERFKSEISARNIRRLSAEGAMDHPDRFGREARYDQRHLDQLIEARALMSKGFSCSAIRSLRVTSASYASDSVLDTLPLAYTTSDYSHYPHAAELDQALNSASSSLLAGSSESGTQSLPGTPSYNVANDVANASSVSLESGAPQARFFAATDLSSFSASIPPSAALFASPLHAQGASSSFMAPPSALSNAPHLEGSFGGQDVMSATEKATAFLNSLSGSTTSGGGVSPSGSQSLPIKHRALAQTGNTQSLGHPKMMSSKASNRSVDPRFSQGFSKRSNTPPQATPVSPIALAPSLAEGSLAAMANQSVANQVPMTYATLELEPLKGVRISLRVDAAQGPLTEEMKAQLMIGLEQAWQQASRQ